MGEHRVHVRAINPKSISLGQLYGEFDATSHEWKDGVLAKAFRCARRVGVLVARWRSSASAYVFCWQKLCRSSTPQHTPRMSQMHAGRRRRTRAPTGSGCCLTAPWMRCGLKT